jgi:hypothetical protein
VLWALFDPASARGARLVAVAEDAAAPEAVLLGAAALFGFFIVFHDRYFAFFMRKSWRPSAHSRKYLSAKNQWLLAMGELST